MTKDKDFKQLARARAARTGESYSTARRNLSAKSADPAPVERNHWFSRATKGYGGKGAKPTGYEAASVVMVRDQLRVDLSAGFSNYGVHRYQTGASDSSGEAAYVYGARAIVVRGRLGQDGSVWSGTAVERSTTDRPISHEFSFELPPGPKVLPSVVARFLPISLAREAGDLAEYVPVPEDGLPGWRPSTRKSWFPLMGASRESLITPRVITCHGVSPLKLGRRTIEAYRYDHVDPDGKVHATTWIGEGDEVVQYEQTGLLLRAVSQEEAQKLDPGSGE